MKLSLCESLVQRITTCRGMFCEKCDDVSTDPVPLIQNLCGISVERDKLVGVLNLYWCADVVAWL